MNNESTPWESVSITMHGNLCNVGSINTFCENWTGIVLITDTTVSYLSKQSAIYFFTLVAGAGFDQVKYNYIEHGKIEELIFRCSHFTHIVLTISDDHYTLATSCDAKPYRHGDLNDMPMSLDTIPVAEWVRKAREYERNLIVKGKVTPVDITTGKDIETPLSMFLKNWKPYDWFDTKSNSGCKSFAEKFYSCLVDTLDIRDVMLVPTHLNSFLFVSNLHPTVSGTRFCCYIGLRMGTISLYLLKDGIEPSSDTQPIFTTELAISQKVVFSIIKMLRDFIDNVK